MCTATSNLDTDDNTTVATEASVKNDGQLIQSVYFDFTCLQNQFNICMTRTAMSNLDTDDQTTVATEA